MEDPSWTAVHCVKTCTTQGFTHYVRLPKRPKEMYQIQCTNNLNNILRLKINTLLLHLCTWECQTYSVPFPSWRESMARQWTGASSPRSRNVPHCANMETIIETYWNSETNWSFSFLWPSFCYQLNTRIIHLVIEWNYHAAMTTDTVRSSLSQWIKNI